ncbi:response regulator [Sinosporangium siamense]|uniref:DNA-binding response regulator n=1 Tax=Sinosporangium siamense TaxID=1367973 RepID=A0A919V7N4_9ACTN|nr:response regulator transcription factor [Sinosporangium siamense]GII93618.1 DNA-binding response regulator [Sinosporangium siamense]
MITILLVDDHALVRSGYRMIVDAQPDMTAVGEAADGEAGLELARRTRPDVVLMDLHMPVLDGVEATRRIVAELPDTKVLVLSTFDLDEHVVDALRAGASGFLPKDISPEELVEAVRVVRRGESAVAARLLTRLIGTFVRAPRTKPGKAPPALAALTEREHEILTLIARGRSNAEIAAGLQVSPSTVKNHVTKMFAKLGVRDRAQAVIIAYETGVVTPGLGTEY